MSRSYRQPVGSQPSVPVGQGPPGRMVAPLYTTGPPAVYPVMPNPYGMLLQQQPQQYISQPVVYPHSSQNIQSRTPFVSGISPTVPSMYVPVAQVPTGMSPTVPDPTKLLEEQRRLEKERNFQMQQERLKQFTVAGKKGSINADNLIDSMFGKFPPKKTVGSSSSSLPPVKSNEFTEIKEEKRPNLVSPSNESSSNSKSSIVSQENSFNLSATSSPTCISLPTKKDPKKLETMMLACSDLNAPSKATKFSKPSVRETIPTSTHAATFVSSEKARDWRNIQGLDDVFIAPKPRFPIWCQREKVDDLYRQIEAAVTHNDQHPPDTNLLFPILKASGLSRESLGQIWELVNESASGQLTVEEMYAALALIAVTQAGYPVKSIDILHQLPSCPVPRLNSVTVSTASPELSDSSTVLPSTEKTTPSETSLSHPPHQQPDHKVIRPTGILLTNTTQTLSNKTEVNDIANSVATWKPFTDSIGSPDDDFDDFKSATPTAINFSLNTPPSVAPALDDDFDDFKQAPSIQVSAETNPSTSIKLPKTFESAKPCNESAPEDLMSPEEDKYSVFRSLQHNNESSQWGDFTFTPVLNNDTSALVKNPDLEESSNNEIYSSGLTSENIDSDDYFKSKSVNIEDLSGDDEFGDFIHANPSSAPPLTSVTDFADFSNFKQPEPESLPSSQIDVEFGEFASSVPVYLKPECGQEFLFRHLKDNISLSESQSVSSLELGTFDGGGGHSGESKSSLSRQGSIPSLDLKTVGLDGTDTEDIFAEIQLPPFVSQNSKSPSPSCNTKGSDDSEFTPVGLMFQSSVPFVDKYSFIRQEKTKEEDQHVSCWIRCLQSCVNILQSTKKIFNQMSCSSVCNEVLSSEEGGNYIKNVTEVYKVVCRIKIASKFLGKQTETIKDLLNEAERVWNTICGFFAGSLLMPEDAALDFSNGILKPEPENNPKACGLCLLNINLRQKLFKHEECPNLSYGGKNYHSPCANFWVNCVDPLLPALTLPQLL